MSESTPTPRRRDIDCVRRLAARKAEIAGDPVNLERRRLWYAQDAGDSARPLVLAEIGGVMGEVMPDSVLECEDPWLRGIECGLRMEIYQFDVLKDDHVVEPWASVNWRVSATDYGVQSVHHRADTADGRLGARRWDAPIKDLDKDFGKLHARTFSVDREGTSADKEKIEKLFDGILPVRIRGGYWWTQGMTWVAIELIGLENLMLFMFDNPSGLHRLMTFLRDDHLAYGAWLEKEGLLNLNNENDYIGSGSMGYTRTLPQRGWREGSPVRMKDLWVLLESQETVGVGPDQFEEFIFPYQRSIAERYGKCYYGCCEPVHTRWHVLKRLPHLARVSVSPWADEEFMGREFGKKIVFSRKPSPTLVSTEKFDEAAIRNDVRHTLEAARGCRVEIIMKDVHTLNRESDRLARWVQITREVIEEVWK